MSPVRKWNSSSRHLRSQRGSLHRGFSENTTRGLSGIPGKSNHIYTHPPTTENQLNQFYCRSAQSPSLTPTYDSSLRCFRGFSSISLIFTALHIFHTLTFPFLSKLEHILCHNTVFIHTSTVTAFLGCTVTQVCFGTFSNSYFNLF